MKVSDILRVKGNTLFTVTPDEPLAAQWTSWPRRTSARWWSWSTATGGHADLPRSHPDHREERRHVGTTQVRSAMDDHPLTCTTETEMDEVRRMMLDRHARYMPVMDKKMLMGVISFYDVAKAVVDSQNFENKMLKAYIRDWPAERQVRTQPSLIPGP
jgi:hypothetical protein